MKKWICAVVSLWYGSVSWGQAGVLDPSFGTGGKVVTEFTDSYFPESNLMVLLPDGKIVVLYGAFNPDNGEVKTQLIRYHADGSPDNGFGTAGIVNVVFPADLRPADMALAADGKFILALQPYNIVATADFVLARLNADGSPDASFGTGGIVSTDFINRSDFVNSVKIQADGKIVAGGYSADWNATLADFAAARYNADGSLDQSFGTGGRQRITFSSLYKYNSVSVVEILPDGKIMLVGKALTPAASSFTLVRLSANGALDASFASGGIAISSISSTDTYISTAALQPDGRILAAGTLNNVNTFVLVRFMSDGTVDNTFGPHAMAQNDISLPSVRPTKIALQSDGKIVTVGVAGYPGNGFVVIRHTPQGMLDAGFGSQGFMNIQMADSNSGAWSVAVQPDQKILVSGPAVKAGKRTQAMVRLLPGGLGIPETGGPAAGVLVFPNPAEKELALSYTLGSAEKLSIDLLDATGKKRASYLNGAFRPPGEYQMPLELPSDLAAGVYYIVLSSPGGKSAVSFIKR